ncbi:hypothetical protein VSS95_28100 [Pseudomonas syringae pv. tagetis]
MFLGLLGCCGGGGGVVCGGLLGEVVGLVVMLGVVWVVGFDVGDVVVFLVDARAG